jgi:tripartite-type tricarboxylate transporter receptor subunit TctC
MLSGTLSAYAAEQPYPAKPIRMMTATTIGSGPDVIARLLGTRLTELWGQQVVVDNRAGASGLIGAELVAKSAPDGHTLWMATMTQLISTTMYQRYMMTKDFLPVAMVASTPFVIAVSSSLPVKTMAEFVAYAKARPGQVMYGSGGQGSTPHLCMELLQSMGGIKLAHVPYKGSVIALTDMMGGQMHSTCAAAPALPPFLQGGKVRSLAVTTRQPTQLAPGLPPVVAAKHPPIGYRRAGLQAIRADLAEKLIQTAHRRRIGAMSRRYSLDPALARSMGLATAGFAALLRAAGFRVHMARPLADTAHGPPAPPLWDWRPPRATTARAVPAPLAPPTGAFAALAELMR